MIKRLGWIMACLLCCLPARAMPLEEAMQGLASSAFSNKEAALQALQVSGDARAAAVLHALQEGTLHVRGKDKSLVIVRGEKDGHVSLEDAASGESLGEVPRRDIKRISLNNKLRGTLRLAVAGMELRAPEADVRLKAASQLAKNRDAALRPLIETALAEEKNDEVKSALSLALAVLDIDSPVLENRKRAIHAFGASLDAELLALLAGMAEKDPDAGVRDAAHTMLAQQQAKVELNRFIENLFFGVSLGSVLLLAAVGLAVTFGVMGVINMAHGEMIMLGAYTTFVIQQAFPSLIEYSVLMAIPAAFLVSGAVGIAIERGIIRRLYGRPLETLLATFGVSLFLQQLVRTVFSPLNQTVVTPEWMSGTWQVNGALALTYNRLYIVVFSLMVLLALVALMRYTRFGLYMRAVTQNRAMARSMGIRSGWVDALTFGLGSGIAGIAGVALSQLTNVGPNLGQAYIIDSFMVVVFGGVGNLFGTFFAAMSLGVVNKFLEPFSGAVLGKILVLIFIILFIQWRPRGLFALKGRAIED